MFGPVSGSISLPSRFSCNEQAGGDARRQRIGHARLAPGIEQIQFLLAMLDDAGLEQHGGECRFVQHHQIVVIPDAVPGIGR